LPVPARERYKGVHECTKKEAALVLLGKLGINPSRRRGGMVYLWEKRTESKHKTVGFRLLEGESQTSEPAWGKRDIRQLRGRGEGRKPPKAWGPLDLQKQWCPSEWGRDGLIDERKTSTTNV